MNVPLEILSQGDEVLAGHIVDSNAAWLARRAIELGFHVTRHSTVGDNLTDLVTLLREIAKRSACCLCTGGLGPTCDDLTSEAVALAFDAPLQFDAIAFAQMQQFFALRQKVMPASNRKQALLPTGAVRLDNHWGTAAGFALYAQGCWFVFLPGVPSEMQAMFAASVKPLLAAHFNLATKTLISLKTIGLGESSIAELIKGIALPDNVQLGFRATSDEVQTKLLFPAHYPHAELLELTAKFQAALGDYVFAIDGLNAQDSRLVSVLDDLLRGRDDTVFVIETVSQGLLAAKCVGSLWLAQAHYQRLTSEWAIDAPHASLLSAASQLAQQIPTDTKPALTLVQLYTGTLLASTTAIVLHTVLFTPQGVYHSQHRLVGALQRKQNQAALYSLDSLRRYLQGKPLESFA